MLLNRSATKEHVKCLLILPQSGASQTWRLPAALLEYNAAPGARGAPPPDNYLRRSPDNIQIKTALIAGTGRCGRGVGREDLFRDEASFAVNTLAALTKSLTKSRGKGSVPRRARAFPARRNKRREPCGSRPGDVAERSGVLLPAARRKGAAPLTQSCQSEKRGVMFFPVKL